MSKAFAEKVMDTIYGNFQNGKKQMSWKQLNIVSEHLEHTPELPNGFIAGYYGNLGKYQVDIADERNTSADRITVIDIKLRDEDEVKAERDAERAVKAKEDSIKAGFANGGHIGNVKERIDIVAELVSSRLFDGYYGPTFCHTFADENGNCIVWFTQKMVEVLGDDDYWKEAGAGSKVTMRATVKEHGEYHGIKQTVITRTQIKAIA